MTDIKYAVGSVESRLLEMAGGIRKPEQSQAGHVAIATYNEVLGVSNLAYVPVNEIGLLKEFAGNAFTNWIHVNLSADPLNNLRLTIPNDGNLYMVESIFVIKSAAKALVYKIDTIVPSDTGIVGAIKYVNGNTYAGLPVSGFPNAGTLTVVGADRVLTYPFSINVGETLTKKYVHYRYAIL